MKTIRRCLTPNAPPPALALLAAANRLTPRALALLAHPLTLSALALMLINDQLLRRLSPSWLTGKLSDAAWLAVVPVVLAALLGLALSAALRTVFWVMRRTVVSAATAQSVQDERCDDPAFHAKALHDQALTACEAHPRPDLADVLFALVLLTIALGFSVVKAVPAVNAWAIQTIYALTHTSPALRLDPSDLLTLPALALPAWLYWRSRCASVTSPRFPSAWLYAKERKEDRFSLALSRLLVPVRLLVLPLAALILMADAAAPDFGIACFQAANGEISAGSGYNSYVTSDGGQTWTFRAETINCPGAAFANPVEPAQWSVAPGPDSDSYRYMPGAPIQHSTDNGAAWQTVYTPPVMSEAENSYYQHVRSGSPVVQSGPLATMADPSSGNMLFAMGHEGVLIHTASGDWTWAAVGDYRHFTSFPTAQAFWTLMSGMLALAFGLALLIFASLALRFTRHPLRYVILTLAWIAWLATAILFAPAITSAYGLYFTYAGGLVAGLLIVPLVIEQTIRVLNRARPSLARMVIIALAGGLAYLLPYVLWMFNLIPGFGLATAIALALAAAALITGIILNRRVPPYQAVPTLRASAPTKTETQ